MTKHSFKCPQCNHITSFSGTPGEYQIVTCPHCHQKGRIKLPGEQTEKTHAIEVKGLRKEYGNLVAVNNISFQVQQGTIFAFLGPNGAGKTTTVEMIESIRQPTAGTINLLGKNIKTHFNDVKEKIGVLPQEFHSFERLTVRETLEYFAKLYKNRANINDILTAMDLQTHANRLYKTLSGGLKQRVGVAISLVNDPDIIFLDEPTTGLDPKARREVWQVISSLRDKRKTVFLTTHYMEEAEYLADHIVIIHRGNIIAEGSLEDLISNYGQGSVLHIRNCRTKETQQLLEQQGYDVKKKHNGDLEVAIEYKDKVLEILSQLRHDCIEYGGIDIRRSNLEEVFLNLTGTKLSEENT